MREVMGENGLNAVLNTAGMRYLIGNFPPANFEPGLTFDEVGQIVTAVEGIYGRRGGQRLLRRSGQASFKYGVEGFGGIIGIADFALRFLPVTLRIRLGLEVLAEILNRYSDQHVTLGENEQHYFFAVEQCGVCWGIAAEQPICYSMVGTLEEILYWVSRGRRFEVEEIACIARGDAKCTFRVSKQPLLS